MFSLPSLYKIDSWDICVLKSCKASLYLYIKWCWDVYNYKQVFYLHEHVKASWYKNSSLCVGLSCIADSQHQLTPPTKSTNSIFNCPQFFIMSLWWVVFYDFTVFFFLVLCSMIWWMNGWESGEKWGQRI